MILKAKAASGDQTERKVKPAELKSKILKG
jgi:hypothetical protein